MPFYALLLNSLLACDESCPSCAAPREGNKWVVLKSTPTRPPGAVPPCCSLEVGRPRLPPPCARPCRQPPLEGKAVSSTCTSGCSPYSCVAVLLTFVQPANQFETVLCPSKNRLALGRVLTTVSHGACLLLRRAHPAGAPKPQQCGTTEWPEKSGPTACRTGSLRQHQCPVRGRLCGRTRSPRVRQGASQDAQ